MACSTSPETEPLLPEKMESPNFTSAIQTSAGKRPQAIAHRGYKAKYPENSMGAFKGAVEVGAHAIETDVHLSKDGVVVLSHDATLKRCFGLDEKIANCDWSYLESLRTIKKPHQPMPRLVDLLEYLTKPGLEDIWILLDIKLDDDPDTLLCNMAAAIKAVKASRKWAERIILGCWNAKYLPICTKHLPDFPITHIGWNIPYARQFLEIPGISFNMLQRMMIGPGGDKFMKDVKKAGRALFLWTVNDDNSMRWSISKQVDGVITDDPKRYLELCRSYNGEKVSISLKGWSTFVFIKVLVPFFQLLVKYKYGTRMSTGRVKQDILIGGGGGRERDHERVE
ncbi:putative glycerophosphoryl diester phosphodiesterase [Leptodontidium sp. MPI-SDFR-AT-0119]|nr:putative glycerophosphoryl diester phosphodiesterase [Leptodontidium sp. MPI-SDFR-AT-0119]